jgi:hypothetical protein
MTDRVKEVADTAKDYFDLSIDELIKSKFDVNNLSDEDQAVIAYLKQKTKNQIDAYHHQSKVSRQGVHAFSTMFHLNREDLQRAYDSFVESKTKIDLTDRQKVSFLSCETKIY